jgi:hypothetical protein
VALEDLLKPYAVKVASTDSSGGGTERSHLYRDFNLFCFISLFLYRATLKRNTTVRVEFLLWWSQP